MKKALKIMGILGGLFVAGIIGIFILLVIFSDSSETSTDVKEEIENETYGIGDTLEYRDMKLTITNAEYTEPSEHSTLENGKVVTVNVEFENESDRKLLVDNTDFNAYDMEGNAMKRYHGYNTTPISGSVDSGKKISGELYFDVVESEQIEIIFVPRYTFDGEIDVKFILDVN